MELLCVHRPCKGIYFQFFMRSKLSMPRPHVRKILGLFLRVACHDSCSLNVAYFHTILCSEETILSQK